MQIYVEAFSPSIRSQLPCPCADSQCTQNITVGCHAAPLSPHHCIPIAYRIAWKDEHGATEPFRAVTGFIGTEALTLLQETHFSCRKTAVAVGNGSNRTNRSTAQSLRAESDLVGINLPNCIPAPFHSTGDNERWPQLGEKSTKAQQERLSASIFLVHTRRERRRQ